MDSTYATWYRPESTFWATYYWDSGASEWKYGLAMSDPSTWVAGSVSVLGTSSYTSSTKTVAGVNVPDDSRSTYPASDVWADPDNGDWTSAGASNPALLAGDRLSTDPASEYAVDIYGDPRDVSNADWDAGATAFTQVAPTPSSLFGLWIFEYAAMTLRTAGTPTVTAPSDSVTGDIEGILRTSGTPTTNPPEGYNNPSDIVYTNPSGVAYDGPSVEQTLTSILGLVRSSGSPLVVNPPQNTASDIVAVARASGTPSVLGPDPVNTASAIEATLSSAGTPSVVDPTAPVCLSCQSIGDIRTYGMPVVTDPSVFINSDILGTIRTEGTPNIGVDLLTSILGTLSGSGTPTVTTPPGVTTSDIEAVLGSSGTPTVESPAQCISCQSIGDIRTQGTPSVALPSDSISSDVYGTARSNGTPTVYVPVSLAADVEATLRTEGTPTVTAPLTSSVRGTLRTAGIPYVNTGWTNPRGERLFIVPQDFRHFVVPFENRNFEVI